MITHLWKKIRGTGVVDGEKVTTTYKGIEWEIPQVAEELTPEMSEMSWDELAQFGYMQKKYLQLQSCARSGKSQDEAVAFAQTTPVGSRAEASLATQIRNADKEGKLDAETKARIAEMLKNL